MNSRRSVRRQHLLIGAALTTAFATVDLGGVPAAQAQRIAVEEVASFGVMSGDPELEFGALTDLTPDEIRNVLYVFDAQSMRLSAFTQDGNFIAAAGRRGAGPGEFRGARAIAGPFGPDSAVYVFDALNRRISKWRLRRGILRRDHIEIVDEITDYAWGGGPVCAIGHSLFLLSYRDGHLIQQIDAEGRLLRSFGQGFRTEDEIIARFTANGEIACHPATNSLYAIATVFPLARKYDAETGALVWEASLPGMIPPLIVRNPRSASRLPMFRKPPGRDYRHSVVSVVAGPNGTVLVQYGPAIGESGRDIVDVTTIVLSAHNGAVMAVRNDFPRLDHSTEQYAYSHANDPFPRVRVYRWRVARLPDARNGR